MHKKIQKALAKIIGRSRNSDNFRSAKPIANKVSSKTVITKVSELDAVFGGALSLSEANFAIHVVVNK